MQAYLDHLGLIGEVLMRIHYVTCRELLFSLHVWSKVVSYLSQLTVAKVVRLCAREWSTSACADSSRAPQALPSMARQRRWPAVGAQPGATCIVVHDRITP